MAPAGHTSPSIDIIDSNNVDNDLESALPLIASVPPPPNHVSSWNQIIAFLLALACCACANSICLFSMFSPGFQHSLGYSPVQINTISIASSLGMYLPVPILGYVADKLGPGNLGIVSIIFFTPTYFTAAYISQLSSVAAAANFHLLVVCFACIGTATSALYFSGVLTCAKMMPRSPGLSISAPVACFGLSSLWQSQILQFYFFDADGNIMLPATFRFFAGLYFVAGITSYVGASVIGKVNGNTIAVVEPEPAVQTEAQKQPIASQNGNYGATPDEPHPTAEPTIDDDDLLYRRHENIAQFLTDRTVWIFYFAFILISGPLEMYLNNMGMILSTIPVNAPSVTTNVSLFSAFSTISRLLMGVLSDSIRNHVSRQIILVLILLFFALINFLMASGVFTVLQNGAFFPLSSSGVGFSYGSVYTLVPTIVACTWGVENLGVHWGIFITAPAIGSTGYGYLFAKVYQAASGTINMLVDGSNNAAPTQCLGRNCYDTTFLATGTSVTIAAILVMVVWLFAWKKHRLLDSNYSQY